MVFVQFLENFLHDCATEENTLGAHMKEFTILPNSRHFTVIQVDNLSMATYKRFLLFL